MDMGDSLRTTLTHCRVRSRCVICDQELSAGMCFVPIVKGITSVCLDKQIFPLQHQPGVLRASQSAHRRIPDKTMLDHQRLLCWDLRCNRCLRQCEYDGVLVHHNCFNLFLENCKVEDAVDRLFVAAISRNVWPGALNLELDPDTSLGLDLVQAKARRIGIPQLASLPHELITMIRDYCPSATFWRYVSAVALGTELSGVSTDDASSSPMQSIPLGAISAWTRGSEPTLWKSPYLHPVNFVIRLAIDRRGIKHIETLPVWPTFNNRRSNKVAFVIGPESQFRNVFVEFKYRVPHLTFPGWGFHVWDMPSPPQLEDCTFCGHIPQSTRFRSIDLPSATGLTFLFSFGKLIGIRTHTSNAPSIKTILGHHRQAYRMNKVVWVYLPLPENEEIQAFGVRFPHVQGKDQTQKPCFLVRTKLAGDISIGAFHHEQYKDVVLSPASPRLLMYNTPDIGPATCFGTYSQERHSDSSLSQFEPLWPPNPPVQHPGMHLSWAPLDGITRMRVFEDRESGSCKGILFEYQNGAQRALGSFCLGVDYAKTYVNPCSISMLPVDDFGPPMPSSSFRVGSLCSPHGHQHDSAIWTRDETEGNFLRFGYLPIRDYIWMIWMSVSPTRDGDDI